MSSCFTVEGVFFALCLLLFGLGVELLCYHPSNVMRSIVAFAFILYSTVAMGMIASAWIGTMPHLFNF